MLTCGIICFEKGVLKLVTNENDFLGLLIKHKNADDTFSINKILKETEMTALQCRPFLISLSDKGIINGIDLETFQINPIAYSVYQSPVKKAKKSFFNFTVFSLQRLLDFLVGVGTGVVVACITKHFFG